MEVARRVYAFWNNKGGTGKTSLAFQAIAQFAEKHADQKVLVIDICPQANLSELLLGGLTGGGSNNLGRLHQESPRRSVGGYLEKRLPSPYAKPEFDHSLYLCKPYNFNRSIPQNVDLFAGDALVELQANAIATLSNTQIPGTNTWLSVISWIADFIEATGSEYGTIFLDANPSFGMYTQQALAAATHLILPVMADDSSRRAVQNAFSLVHGIHLPSAIYSQFSFTTKLRDAGRSIPKVHAVVKNRLTQYMGPASAYFAVLRSIDGFIDSLLKVHPEVFTFTHLREGVVEVRDFQTTGVVAFAEGKPFSRLVPGKHLIMGRETQVNASYIHECQDAIDSLVGLL